MNPVQAIILGIIQGLTEFLPISSSGHLVLCQRLFGLNEPEMFFDISVHVGTLFAVIIYFRKDIWAIILSLSNFVRDLLKRRVSPLHAWEDPDLRLALLIIIGSLPTGLIGMLFSKIADRLFSSIFIVGCALMVTGFLLWLTRWAEAAGRDMSGFSIRNALVIGVAQGLAITPGISRSGTTIAVGLLLGLSRETAARYSFLLSIPAILGAAVLALSDVSAPSVNMVICIGAVTAGVVGYGALAMLVYIVKKGQLHLFSPYCWLVGSVALIWGW